MPKVLFIAPSAYTLSGLATWLDYLVPGLRGMGWESNLGLVSGPRHHVPDRYLDVHPLDGVRVAHAPTITDEGRKRALLRLLEETRPDVAVSVNIPDLFPAINHLRERHKPSPLAVMSVHGIEAFLYADARKYGDMLDAAVCTNRLACALAMDLGRMPEQRVRYAPYGVDLPATGAAAASSERLRIVYSGRLENDQKRVHDLVAIVAGLQRRDVPFHLQIAGDGPERERLQAALAQSMENGSVVFHGQLPMDRLKSEVYSHADALIITSMWETGPIVAWEAMAQGVPVVSSRYIGSALEGALEDNRTALLYPIGDAEAAATALARLHLESGLRTRLGEAGAELVRSRYSIPASVRAWDEVLRSICAQPVRGPAALPAPAAKGRLDRWFGAAAAETIRSGLALRPPHAAGPGGEWPHSHQHSVSDEAFWRLAQERDSARSAAYVD